MHGASWEVGCTRTDVDMSHQGAGYLGSSFPLGDPALQRTSVVVTTGDVSGIKWMGPGMAPNAISVRAEKPLKERFEDAI